MIWEAAGAIGEIVGAIAVVATLAYLAHETRTNTKAVAAASERASNWGFAEFNTLIARDPELAALVMKSFQRPMAEYTELEWLRFQLFARSEANRIQDAFVQSRYGFFDPEQAELYLDHLRGLIEIPAWRVWWGDETKGANFLDEFVENVNSRAAAHVGMTKLTEIED